MKYPPVETVQGPSLRNESLHNVVNKVVDEILSYTDNNEKRD